MAKFKWRKDKQNRVEPRDGGSSKKISTVSIKPDIEGVESPNRPAVTDANIASVRGAAFEMDDNGVIAVQGNQANGSSPDLSKKSKVDLSQRRVEEAIEKDLDVVNT